MATLTRTQLLALAHERERTTSFAPLLSAPGPALATQTSQMQSQMELIYGTTQAKPISPSKTSSATSKDVNITYQSTASQSGYQPTGRYYSVKLDFALAKNPDPILKNVPSPALTDQEKLDWGTGFHNPLVNPHKNCVYCVRCTIDQLGVDPPYGGYKLRWVLPTGWGYADGIEGKDMYVEVSSNPLIVVRKFRSPTSTIKNSVFRVLVIGWYP